ncbi:BglG family transcription antiterminator [Paenibacillus peoriae]|uniref:BglG family transcription antiterminator n=1 Tax=Paenibacillus peoriae TaxID=59893 RepID=UPI00026C568F|nr:BglG family transcription antiterminator [Paenibacillus peoriae]MEC0181031.1 BglG family transcription antiterminator [Paenibacillus peoriae]
MSLDERSSNILTKLLGSSSHISINELTSAFQVSKRTIYYDIEKINDWLKDNKLSPVYYVRSAGFHLDEDTRKQAPDKFSNIQQWNYEYSQKERKALIAVYIIGREKRVQLEDLINRTRVSRNTAIEDLRLLRSELQDFQTTLLCERHMGYYMKGSEENIRKALTHYLSQLTVDLEWSKSLFTADDIQLDRQPAYGLFEIEQVKSIYLSLTLYERTLKIRFADDTLRNLSIQLFYFLRRMLRRRNVKVDAHLQETLKDSAAFSAASKTVVPVLERLSDLPIPSDEIFYLTMHLRGAKLHEMKQSRRDSSSYEKIRDIARRMIDDFQQQACIVFQERAGLEEGLTVHLQSAYHRIQYNLDAPNPLKEMIQDKYKDVYVFTLKVVHHFEIEAGVHLDEDAVAFIAMHFGGWMKREGVLFLSRVTAVVVCASGIGTSQMLKKQLQELFPMIDFIETMAIHDYETAMPQADFVFSTSPLRSGGNEVFLVSPILSDVEKINLLKKIYAKLGTYDHVGQSIEGLIKIIRKHAFIRNEEQLYGQLRDYMARQDWIRIDQARRPMLNELLTPSRIQRMDRVGSWEDGVAAAAWPLLKEGAIADSYVEAMVENVKQRGPYIIIAPLVAVPHADPLSGVNKTGISLLVLKEGIAFSEQPEHEVRLIFTLAAMDNETHLRALSQFTSLLTDEGNIERLFRSQSTEEIMEIILQYSV